MDNRPDEGRVGSSTRNRNDSINDSIFDELDGITLELSAGLVVLEDGIKIRKVGSVSGIKGLIDPGKIRRIVFTKPKIDIL